MGRVGKCTVLVALVGMSPAVLTETIWALAAKDGIVPSEIVVLTTTRGKDALEKSLYGQDGFWDGFAKDMERSFPDIPGVAGLKSLRVRPDLLRDASGADAEDIRTPEDALASADQMLRLLRGIMTPRNRLMVSIAGGRKTMGALLFSCMTLLGRKDDRVLHVLVNSPYDSPGLTPPFFYPSATAHTLPRQPSQSYLGTDAQLSLFDVPFVRMRNFYQNVLKEGNYAELVGAVGRLNEVERIELLLDETPPLHIGDRDVTLNPQEAVALWWFWKKEGDAEKCGLAMKKLKDCVSKNERVQGVLLHFRDMGGRFKGDDPKLLAQDWSKTMSALKKRLAKDLSEEYVAALLPKRGGVRIRRFPSEYAASGRKIPVPRPF